MLNETPEKLSEKLVREHLCYVTENKTAWVLVQEPGFIGFGVVRQDKIFWPPYIQPPIDPIDWGRVSDLRLFGEKGEWHVWLDWERKHRCRLLDFDGKGEWRIWLGWDGKSQDCPLKSGKQSDTLPPEYHALWGTDVKPCSLPWIKLVEERGAEIWLPLEKEELKDTDDLPLRLKLKQVVDYDPESHLAGIVDAALVGLVRRSCKELLPPTDLSICS